MVNRSITVQSCYAKNGETRTVPMTDDLFAALERLKNERDRQPEDLVFINRYGKPWKSWRTAFENAVERAGIKDFKFHDLRHCFGSWLAMNGVTDKGRMELMGHRTALMSLRYAHLSVEYKRQAVAKLPSFRNLEGKSPQIPPSVEAQKVVAFG
jgi:integrase